MHEAFFFGPDERRIFASYHPPARGEGSVLTVVCPPLFLDYTRTQAALRRLALSLAEQGQHVLRFDYRGTGDSSADLEQVTIADWMEDVTLAVQEGRDLADPRKVRLLAVRASALLAARIASGAPGDIDRVVFWDPVLDGATYLNELRTVQSALLDRHFRLPREQRREAALECAGQRVSDRMVEEFRGLTAQVYADVPPGKMRIVRTTPGDRLRGETASGDLVSPPCAWQDDTEDLIMVRPLLLERLAACLTLP